MSDMSSVRSNMFKRGSLASTTAPTLTCAAQERTGCEGLGQSLSSLSTDEESNLSAQSAPPRRKVGGSFASEAEIGHAAFQHQSVRFVLAGAPVRKFGQEGRRKPHDILLRLLVPSMECPRRLLHWHDVSRRASTAAPEEPLRAKGRVAEAIGASDQMTSDATQDENHALARFFDSRLDVRALLFSVSLRSRSIYLLAASTLEKDMWVAGINALLSDDATLSELLFEATTTFEMLPLHLKLSARDAGEAEPSYEATLRRDRTRYVPEHAQHAGAAPLDAPVRGRRGSTQFVNGVAAVAAGLVSFRRGRTRAVSSSGATVVTTVTLQQHVEGEGLVNRSYLLHGSAAARRSGRLVVAFHGLGEAATTWVDALQPFVARGDFLGVYPEGLKKNGGPSSWNCGPEPSNADDVAFVDAVLASLRSQGHPVSAAACSALGYSNGGALVMRLACERAHFGRVATVVTALNTTQSPSAAASLPALSVLQVMGMKDRLIPYGGGPSRVGHTFLAGRASAQTWADFACGGGAPDAVTASSGSERLEWHDDASGACVAHVGIAEGDHRIHDKCVDAELGLRGLYPLVVAFLLGPSSSPSSTPATSASSPRASPIAWSSSPQTKAVRGAAVGQPSPLGDATASSSVIRLSPCTLPPSELGSRV